MHAQPRDASVPDRSGMRRLLRDKRILPLLLHLVLGALSLYWIWFVVRCGEDECIDRPVVAAIALGFWVAGAAVVARAQGAGRSQTVLRWAGGTLWLIAAAAFLLVLSVVGFDVVYD